MSKHKEDPLKEVKALETKGVLVALAWDVGKQWNQDIASLSFSTHKVKTIELKEEEDGTHNAHIPVIVYIAYSHYIFIIWV